MKRQTLLLAILVLGLAFRPGARLTGTAQLGQESVEPGRIVGVVARVGTGEPLPDATITVVRDNTASGSAASSQPSDQGQRAATLEVMLSQGITLVPSAQRGAAAQLRAVTNAMGEFVIENVPPGRYTVTATADGYFAPPVGGAAAVAQMRVNTTVKAGNAAEVLFSMIPGAVIAGRVQDPKGRIVVDAQVQAFRVVYQPDGSPSLQQFSNRQTDDRGEYRLYRLPPGEYYIVVNPRNTVPVEPGVRENQFRTFYPSALTPSLSPPLVVRGGEDFANINVQIRSASLAKVSGRVVYTLPETAFDPPTPVAQRGQPLTSSLPAALANNTDPTLQPLIEEYAKAQNAMMAADMAMSDVQSRLSAARGAARGNLQPGQRPVPTVQLQLIPRDRNALVDPNSGTRSMTAQMALPNDGKFEFSNVLPGAYDLYASLPDNMSYGPQQPPGPGVTGRSFGRVSIDVGDGDLTDVTVSIHRGADIHGRLIVDGKLATFPNAHIVLQPDDSAVRVAIYQQVGRSEAQIAADGSFTIPVVPEALYRVGVSLGGVPPAQRGGRGNTSTAGLDSAAIREIEMQLQLGGGNVAELIAAARGRAFPQTTAAIPDAYIADVRHNGVSIYDNPLSIGEATAGFIDVYVQTNAGSIAGTVVGADQRPTPNATVVLVPPGPRRGNTDLFRTATSDAEGKFTIKGLGPGDFKLFAWQSINGSAYLNPTFLAAYEGRGAGVSIFAGGQLTAEVPLITE